MNSQKTKMKTLSATPAGIPPIEICSSIWIAWAAPHRHGKPRNYATLVKENVRDYNFSGKDIYYLSRDIRDYLSLAGGQR